MHYTRAEPAEVPEHAAHFSEPVYSEYSFFFTEAVPDVPAPQPLPHEALAMAMDVPPPQLLTLTADNNAIELKSTWAAR